MLYYRMTRSQASLLAGSFSTRGIKQGKKYGQKSKDARSEQR